MNDTTTKNALVVGVANTQSLGWGCAQALAAAGFRVWLTAQNTRDAEMVAPLAASLGAELHQLDVTQPTALHELQAALNAANCQLDCLVHSVAFAPKADLHGPLAACSLTGFLQAMDISCHSLLRLVQQLRPLLRPGASILTLSYLGSQRVVPAYGLMGPVKAALEAVVRGLAIELAPAQIRVNAIAPGPMPTRAANGIRDFSQLLNTQSTPLAGPLTLSEVGALAAFLASDGARSITGQIWQQDLGKSALA